ncbi:MAG: VOC family protein [Acidimicrobiales bacterium]|nr:VOC family protein [Acidimicrobiales bacterium]
MLTTGFNHVAVITTDTERFVEFYSSVFGATSFSLEQQEHFRLTAVVVGPSAEFNVFQADGNTEADKQVPMLGRGRIDHLALQAESLDAFDEIRRRLMERDASDGFVTDFGPILSVFYRDPDGLESEVCVANPDYTPGGPINPPGTPAKRYHPED